MTAYYLETFQEALDLPQSGPATFSNQAEYRLSRPARTLRTPVQAAASRIERAETASVSRYPVSNGYADGSYYGFALALASHLLDRLVAVRYTGSFPLGIPAPDRTRFVALIGIATTPVVGAANEWESILPMRFIPNASFFIPTPNPVNGNPLVLASTEANPLVALDVSYIIPVIRSAVLAAFAGPGARTAIMLTDQALGAGAGAGLELEFDSEIIVKRSDAIVTNLI